MKKNNDTYKKMIIIIILIPKIKIVINNTNINIPNNNNEFNNNDYGERPRPIASKELEKVFCNNKNIEKDGPRDRGQKISLSIKPVNDSQAKLEEEEQVSEAKEGEKEKNLPFLEKLLEK